MSFSSFVSSLPVFGPVSSLSSVPAAVRAAGPSDASVASASAALRARLAPVSAAPVSLLASVPRARWSAAVSVVAVSVTGADAVSVVCSDGRVRVCRPSFAARALGRPVSVDAVVSRLSARVGSSVRFCAAFGYSPDTWFVGVEAAPVSPASDCVVGVYHDGESYCLLGVGVQGEEMWTQERADEYFGA
jgi:hypothetical protein